MGKDEEADAVLIPLLKKSSEIWKAGISGCRKKRSNNGTFF